MSSGAQKTDIGSQISEFAEWAILIKIRGNMQNPRRTDKSAADSIFRRVKAENPAYEMLTVLSGVLSFYVAAGGDEVVDRLV